ncbi:MAG: hypothetical protein LE168_01710, partial [Endomicrobium sp.]|nr:hypothetical protein [Endomicrobium sp.]
NSYQQDVVPVSFAGTNLKDIQQERNISPLNHSNVLGETSVKSNLKDSSPQILKNKSLKAYDFNNASGLGANPASNQSRFTLNPHALSFTGHIKGQQEEESGNQEDLKKAIEKYISTSGVYNDAIRRRDDAKKTFDNALKDNPLPKILEEAIRERDTIQKRLEWTKKDHPLAKARDELFDKLVIFNENDEKVVKPLEKALNEVYKKFDAAHNALMDNQFYKDKRNARDKFNVWKTNPLYKDFFEKEEKYISAIRRAANTEDIALKKDEEEARDELLYLSLKMKDDPSHKDFFEDKRKWGSAEKAYNNALKDDPRNKDLHDSHSKFFLLLEALTNAEKQYPLLKTYDDYKLAKKALDDVVSPLQEELNEKTKKVGGIQRDVDATLSPLQKVHNEILTKIQEELDKAAKECETAKNDLDVTLEKFVKDGGKCITNNFYRSCSGPGCNTGDGNTYTDNSFAGDTTTDSKSNDEIVKQFRETLVENIKKINDETYERLLKTLKQNLGNNGINEETYAQLLETLGHKPGKNGINVNIVDLVGIFNINSNFNTIKVDDSFVGKFDL